MNRERAEISVMADADALARAAGNRILECLTRGTGRLAVCLAGGTTPERLYGLMAREPYRRAMPWERIHWFWGDERIVPQSDPRSNAGMARRQMLDRIPVPPGNIHAVPTEARTAEAAARLYEGELRRFYGAEQPDPRRPLFDVVLMGVGQDGHTASLFPDHPALEEKERWVVGINEPDLEPYVPRVTLTFPTLASAREMLFLVSGQAKREIVAHIFAGADLPAARAYCEGKLVWLLDRAAAPERLASSDDSEQEPCFIVVMGVSGSGKSTIASLLAIRLGWIYEDADWLHPPANFTKMHSGQPLTDEDRWPWLQAIATLMDQTRTAGKRMVIACSALKRTYREILVGGRRDVRIVYLQGDRQLIALRMSLRHGHFMPPSLLDSQFAVLQEPEPDERPIIVPIDGRPSEIVERIVTELGIAARGLGDFESKPVGAAILNSSGAASSA
jgi:6-phosphogluconolactonase